MSHQLGYIAAAHAAKRDPYLSQLKTSMEDLSKEALALANKVVAIVGREVGEAPLTQNSKDEPPSICSGEIGEIDFFRRRISQHLDEAMTELDRL